MRPKSRPLFAASSVAGFAAAIAAGALGGPGSHHPVSSTPTTTTTPSSGTTGPTGATRSTTGASENYGYGAVAVDVTVKGRRIVGLSVASLSTVESYSQSLAQQVIPMLKGEVLASQSAQVSGVTGATYTSQAYLSSIQSALDTLGV